MESSTDPEVINFTTSDLDTIQEVNESITPEGEPFPNVDGEQSPELQSIGSGASGDTGSTVSIQSIKSIEQVPEAPYDITLGPRLYTELAVMLQGTSFSNVNWVILLTKTMSIVSQVKGLNKQAKVALSVDLVIKYLDEKTSLSNETLVIIKGNVLQMCTNILDGQSILKGTKKEQVSNDSIMRTSPQQIVSLLITVIENSTNTWSLNTLISQSTGIILTCIKITEKFQHLTGIEKREIIINAINKIVETKFKPRLIPGSPEDVSISLLVASLPVMIDTLVAVGKGKPAFKFDFQDPATYTCLINIFTTLFKLCKK
jgi:hypothetical protein